MMKEAKAFLKFNLKKIFLYINREIELENPFYESFPHETLLFITQDSLTTIKSPELFSKYKMSYNISNLITPVLLDSILSKNQLSKAGQNNYALAA